MLRISTTCTRLDIGLFQCLSLTTVAVKRTIKQKDDALLKCITIGGGLGFLIHVFGALLVETLVIDRNAPDSFIPYGQFFGMVILPIGVVVGAGYGLLAFGISRKSNLAIAGGLFTGLASATRVIYLWHEVQLSRGSDDSDVVLFPLPALSACTLIATSLIAAIRQYLRKNHE